MTDTATQDSKAPPAEPAEVTQLRGHIRAASDALDAVTAHSADREKESTERRLAPAKEHIAAALALLAS